MNEKLHVDKEIILYVLMPLFYWAIIQLCYKLNYYWAFRNALKMQVVTTWGAMWLSTKSFLICLVIWYFIQDLAKYGPLNHFFKICVMFVLPSMIGAIRAIIKRQSLSSDELSDHLKKTQQ